MRKELVTVKFDRTNRLKNGKKGEVELEVYLSRHCRKRIHVTTITNAEWATYQHSKELQAEKLRIESICRAMIVLEDDLTMENLNKRLGIETKKVEDPDLNDEEYERQQLLCSKTSFLDFFEREYKKQDYAISSVRRKKVVLNTLKEFGKIKKFEDLTPRNVQRFDKWLDNGERVRTTITNFHKHLRRTILRSSPCCRTCHGNAP